MCSFQSNTLAIALTAGFFAVNAPAAQLGPTRVASGSVAAAQSTTPLAGAVSPVISANGRRVAFLSEAVNLVTNPVSGAYQVYLRDLVSSNTVLVSANSLRAGGNDHSLLPSVSSNGNFVVFESMANDLVANDTNEASDIFLREMSHGITLLVSINATGTVPGAGASRTPMLSQNGRYVAFESTAPDLVAGDANGKRDVFVRDLLMETTTLLSGSASGTAELLDMSSDGRLVAFFSDAPDFFPGVTHNRGEIYVRDMELGVTYWATRSQHNTNGGSRRFRIALAPGGRYAALQNLAVPGPSVGGDVYLLELPSQSSIQVESSGWAVPGLAVDAEGTVTYHGPSGIFSRLTDGRKFLLVPATTFSDAGIITPQIAAFRVSGTGRLLYNTHPSQGAAAAQIYIYDTLTRESRLVTVDGGLDPINRNVRGPFSVDHSGFSVAYESAADDVVTNDLNGVADVFVANGSWYFSIYSGTNHLVSQRHAALPDNAGRGFATLAPGSPFVATGDRLLFLSTDSTLVPNDTNTWQDLFAHDFSSNRVFSIHGPLVQNNPTNLVAQTNAPLFPSVSADGRFAVYERTFGDQLGAPTNAYRADLISGRIQPFTSAVLGAGSVSSARPSLSQDGRWVAFQTNAQIAVLDFGDPFIPPSPPVHYLASIRHTGIGGGNNTSWSPVITPDGRQVVFLSRATDLTTHTYPTPIISHVFARDLRSHQTRLLSIGPGGGPASHGATNFVVSANGRFVAFQALTNPAIYRHDLRSAATNTLVCTGCANPSISGDGRFVSYQTTANPSQVQVVDLQIPSLELISLDGNAASTAPVISQNGRFVAFTSLASNLVPNDANGVSDVFLHDRWHRTTMLLSRNAAGTGTGNGASSRPVFSPDGSTVAFQSFASDLVAGDYNRRRDVFVVRLLAIDTDGDGLDDDWEQFHFQGLARTGAEDFDGDGYPESAEFLGGTDPRDPNSLLEITDITVLRLQPPLSGEQATLTWAAAPGRTYRVQMKTDLRSPLWANLPGDVVSGSSIGAKSHSAPVASNPRFYRVQLVPQGD